MQRHSSGASQRAKSDLKRELKSIRPAIADSIVAKISTQPSSIEVPDDRSSVLSFDSTTDTHTDAGTEITEEDYINGSGAQGEELRPPSVASSEVDTTHVSSPYARNSEALPLLIA
jgi:hypothetical protein